MADPQWTRSAAKGADSRWPLVFFGEAKKTPQEAQRADVGCPIYFPQALAKHYRLGPLFHKSPCGKIKFIHAGYNVYDVPVS
ncbi:MAG: hypothetical protein HY588_01865 [Candidatus Omnitrophica bacterium]|nr:hypothetical protein [Candidatus Omnitrophota bacterium]